MIKRHRTGMLVGPYSLDVLVCMLICKTGVVSLPVSRPVLVSQLPSGHLSNEEISLVTPPGWERDFALLILRRFATIPALGQPRLTASTADGSSTSRGVTTGITLAGSGASAVTVRLTTGRKNLILDSQPRAGLLLRITRAGYTCLWVCPQRRTSDLD